MERGIECLSESLCKKLDYNVRYSYLVRIEKDNIAYATLSERQRFFILSSSNKENDMRLKALEGYIDR